MPIWLLVAAATPSVAQTADYKPVQCAGRKTFKGIKADIPSIVTFPQAALRNKPVPATIAEQLEKAFATARQETNAPAIGVALTSSKGWTWSKSSEHDNRLFYWASVGKAYTAVAVLQLVEEKRLLLDDRLAKWYPALPNAKHITILDLLQHRSGLFSANEDPDWNKAGLPGMTAADHDAILNRHGAMFCPGEHWRYSNSGYTLLGRILERVEGTSYKAIIDRRIIWKLGLGSTIVVTENNKAQVAPASSKKIEKLMDLTAPGAAGPIAASPADMLRFWSAVFEGRVISEKSRDLMFAHLVPGFDSGTYFGAGAMVIDVPDGSGRLMMLGHAGGMPGISAWAGYNPQRNLLVAVSITGDSSAPAVANLLLKAIDLSKTQ